MAKVILICGKICSGKTTLARSLLRENNSVLLSCDELADVLFDKNLGDRHDEVMARAREYLHRKAADLLAAGCDVILDWGFWKKADRQAARMRYEALGADQLWYYLDPPPAQWQRNIERRNAAVLCGASRDYFVDEGLLKKLLANFEEPAPEEYDIVYGRSDTGV